MNSAYGVTSKFQGYDDIRPKYAICRSCRIAPTPYSYDVALYRLRAVHFSSPKAFDLGDGCEI